MNINMKMRNSSWDEDTWTWRDILSDYLLTLIHRYPLNRKQFRFSGYLWMSVSKQITRSRHVWVFSSRDEFLVIHCDCQYWFRIGTMTIRYMRFCADRDVFNLSRYTLRLFTMLEFFNVKQVIGIVIISHAGRTSKPVLIRECIDFLLIRYTAWIMLTDDINIKQTVS